MLESFGSHELGRRSVKSAETARTVAAAHTDNARARFVCILGFANLVCAALPREMLSNLHYFW